MAKVRESRAGYAGYTDREAQYVVVECYVRAKPSDVFSDLTVPDRLPRWWATLRSGG
jgi:uncharacterized protein YndB with AHSA1/START domain